MNTSAQPSHLRSRSFAVFAAALAFATMLSAEMPLDLSLLSAEVVPLERYDVEASRAKSYTAAAAPSSTKLQLSLLESAQNIQVIPGALLADQGAIRLEDALRNVAGVTIGGYYENWDYFRIRGFDSSFNTFVDGLRGANAMGEELFGLEQVEIVKGPASSLFGQAPLGGVVNLVSKRPRADTFVRTELTYGTWDFTSASLDFNAPLGASPNLLFRLPAIVIDQPSFVDYAARRTVYLAPALTWKASPDTNLTLLAKYKENDLVHAMPLPAVGTVLPSPHGAIPLDRFVGEPGTSNAYENSGQIGYEFTHRLNDTIALRQNVRYDRYVQGWRDLLYPGYLAADQRTLYRYPYNYWQDFHELAVDSRLEFSLNHGAVRHEIVAGVDQYRKTYHARWQTIDFADPTGYGYIGIDLYAPVYGTPIPRYQPMVTSAEKTFNTGGYLHDHVELGRNVTVTLGGRYDSAEAGGHRVDEFTPSAGLTWEVRRGAALYANYSESFTPQDTWMVTSADQPVDPETGTNWEAGLKTAATDGRLTATVALFELTRQNVATSDLSHPGYYLVSGEQRSRGFEFDGRFSPLPGWEITAAYAYTDARITRDNTLPVGERTAGVPYHAVNLWTKYTFAAGPLKNFGVGLGARYYSSQVGDVTHTHYFELPGYTLAEAALYYTRGRFTAQLNASNLLDRRYFTGAYNDLYVLPGSPRSLRATIGWSF